MEDDLYTICKRDNLQNFNPRPPCGGRHGAVEVLRAKGVFQSTSPVWRTTRTKYGCGCWVAISIHVPRVEDDASSATASAFPGNFNPRPPCGGRPKVFNLSVSPLVFQSTSPVWRTTPSLFSPPAGDSDFNPRPPCGGRRR